MTLLLRNSGTVETFGEGNFVFLVVYKMLVSHQVEL